MDKKPKEVRQLQAKTALNIVYSFVVLTVTNYLVLSIANWLFPQAVVFGTANMSSWWAMVLSAEKLALMGVVTMAYVYYKEWKRGKNYSPKEWMTTYFFVNVVTIWVVTRFTAQYGFGISSWFVAVLLGAALDWAQGMAMMAYGRATGTQT